MRPSDSWERLSSGWALAAFIVVAYASTASAQTDKLIRASNPVDGQYIVKFTPSARAALGNDLSRLAASLTATYGGTVTYVYAHVLGGFAVKMTASQAEVMAQDEAVEYVEEDRVASASETQSPATWGIDRIDQPDLPLTNSYTYNYNGQGVKAYIVDSGIRRTHSEFGGRALSGFTAIEDGYGTNDCNGHGTHVAGTVGGATYGVAKGVTLVAVRVLNCLALATNSSILAGVDWVTGDHEQGEPAVANMSLRILGMSPAFEEAVNESIADGVTYVAASGNDNEDACGVSPARIPDVITVNASQDTDQRSEFSNWGVCTDIFAPGSAITSAGISDDDAIRTLDGTSMAAPHVTGVAALYLQRNRCASPETVWSAIESSATLDRMNDPGPGSPNRLLYSLLAAGPGSSVPCAPTGLVATALSDTQLRLTWVDQSGNENRFVLQRSENGQEGPFVTIGEPGANQTSFVDSVSPCTTYDYRIKAVNAAGSSDFSTALYVARPCDPPVALEPGAAWPQTACLPTPTPTLLWTAVPRADFYRVRVLRDDDVAVVNEEVTATSLEVPPGALQQNVRYHWKVKAENAQGFSPYSNILAFEWCAGVSALSVNDGTVGEGTGTNVDAIFTVSLSAASAQTVTVNYATSPGTAIANNDFTPVSGQLTFAPGVTSRTIAVPVIGDALDEPAETFFVDLSSPGNATLGDGQGLGTIEDDDPPPALYVDDRTIVEGNSGSVDAIFTVSLSVASTQTVTVSYATAPGTARADRDFRPVSGSLTFAPGVTMRTIAVPVIGDVLDEPTEAFFVDLSNPTNATIADGRGQGSIEDDDLPPTVSIGDVALMEGDPDPREAVLQVLLSAPSGQTVSANFATVDGTATAPSDYMAKSGSVTFAEGETSTSISVSVVGDTVWEPEENLYVDLSGLVNATAGDTRGQIAIINDDVPFLAINDVYFDEGPPDRSKALTVTLNAPSIVDVTVSYQTFDCTASKLSDYTPQSGTLTFIPGQTQKTILVPSIGDGEFEASETVLVELSSPTQATIADGRGQVTLVNDDPNPNPPLGLLPADFNGDGRTDIIWRHDTSGQLSAWAMNGINLIEGKMFDTLADLNWKIVGTADFDGDGKTDILWRHDVSGGLAVWRMDGLVRTGGILVDGISDTDWTVVGTGSFNGDMWPDILWRNQATGQLEAWLMDGLSVASKSPLNPGGISDVGWGVVATGDFNHDGKTDVLWRNQGSARLMVWLMDGLNRTDEVPLTPSNPGDASWQPVAAGDFNGDEHTDTVWRHQSSGGLVVWLMNGTRQTCGVYLNPDRINDPNWRMVGPR